MEATAAEVSVVVPVAVSNVAVMVGEPVVDVAAVARPLMLIAAIPVSEELHVTYEVRSCVAPFRSVPSAENWTDVPLAMVGSEGDKAIDWGGEVVSAIVPIMF